MSKEIKRRGGTSVEHDSFIGASKEITVDTTNNTLRVHDSVTPGGHKIDPYGNRLTTQALINGSINGFPAGEVVITPGYSVAGDGGGASWKKTGVTGTPSQSPQQLGDTKFNDADGNEWELSTADSSYNLLAIGGKALPGAPIQGSETSYNKDTVVNDDVDQQAISGSKVNGYRISLSYGGSNATGGRHGAYGVVIQESPTSPSNTDRNYVGIQGQSISSTGDGGTGIGAAISKGAYFAVSGIVNLNAGAVNVLNVTGLESNTRCLTGSSVWLKSGNQVVCKDEIQGLYDCAYLASASSSAIGYKTGILFSDTNGGIPLGTGATVFQLNSILGNTYDLHSAFDFSNCTFTNNIFKFPNYTKTANGSTEIGSLSSSSVITNDYHTSGNNIDYDYRIQYSGGTGTIGEGVATYIGKSLYKGEVRPAVNGTYNLGDTLFKWSNIFGDDLHATNRIKLDSKSSAPTTNVGTIAVDDGTNWSGVNATGNPRPVFFDGTSWVAMT